MLRVYATIFAERPNGDLLRRYLDPNIGFRLLRHKTSEVYFLVAYQDNVDLSSQPILSTGPVRVPKATKSTLLTEEKAGRLSWGTYRPDIINDSIWLSEKFQLKVMVAYFDDDGSDNVSIANQGTLDKVHIRGSPIGDEGKVSNEIEISKSGLAQSRRVERNLWNDIFEREFKFHFGQSAPDLTDQTYSEFELIESEEPKPTSRYQFYERHRQWINILLLPITLALVIWTTIKGRIKLKHFVIGGMLMAALISNFFFKSSPLDGPTADVTRTEQSMESLCADKSNTQLKKLCDRYAELEGKSERDSKALDLKSESAPEKLISYEASEFEPSWSLTLTDGKLINFRQLDPDSGAGFVTDSYRVKYQTGSEGGFAVHGAGEKGDFMFSTLDVSGDAGCTHSGSGATHRDKVTVASPRKIWVGCGGPEL